MVTTVTVKGQVTLPKGVREAAGIHPGDRVEVRATAAGVIIEKADQPLTYRERLERLAKRRLITVSAEELLLETRGDPAEDPPFPKR